MDAVTFAIAAWKICRDNWQIILGGFLVVVVIAGYNHQINAAEKRGAEAERAKQEKLFAAEKKRADTAEKSVVDIHRRLEIALSNVRERIRTVTKINTEEVTKYVTLNSDRMCTIPVGLVQHHDAAADGRAVNPAPAVSLVDAPSGIALSRVETVVADNYGLAHEWRAELVDCRARYTSAWEAIERFKAGKPP